jgi:DNA-binding Xre family transcriptional regulator
MQIMDTGYTKKMIVWRLKEVLHSLGMSRYALQKQTGIAMNTIRSMYDGETQRPDLRLLEQILEALKAKNPTIGLADLLEWQPITPPHDDAKKP